MIRFFLSTSSLGFLLFKTFDKKLSSLVNLLVLRAMYLWRFSIKETIPRKVKGQTVGLCVVWKAVSERNFPESSIKCSTVVIPLRNHSLKNTGLFSTLTSELRRKGNVEKMII